MHSKHDIFRAMRNRGVEIYMLNEKEDNETNDFDLKSLISLKGLNSKNHINALIETHEFINDLIIGMKQFFCANFRIIIFYCR